MKKTAYKKRAKKEQGKDKSTDGIIKLMAKMQLQHAQMLREQQGVLFDVVFMDTESDVIKEMQEKGASYSEQTQGKRGHNMGPPHLHIFDSMMSALIKKKDEIGAQNYNEIGRLAIELLLRKLSDTEDPASTKDQILLKSDLMLRRSA